MQGFPRESAREHGMQNGKINARLPNYLLRRRLKAQEIEGHHSRQHKEIEVAARGGLTAGAGAKDHRKRYLGLCA